MAHVGPQRHEKQNKHLYVFIFASPCRIDENGGQNSLTQHLLRGFL
jgi:hypothetical protein